MLRKLVLTSLLVAGAAAAAVSPADARGWTYTGPHGATITHWGSGPCCYRGGVAVGAIAGFAVGTAVGVAAAARPVLPPPVVYAPPPVVYAPPVIYAPGAYYYVR
jgi:hypothetical protein